MTAPAQQLAAPRERPILFKDFLVRAILEERKTCTRRLVQPKHVSGSGWGPIAKWIWSAAMATKCIAGRCPYGGPGDRLWVRETCIIAPKRWGDHRFAEHVIDSDGDPRLIQYLASQPCREAADEYKLKATPSIHMPRWASRIDLELTGVRVERAQDISDADILAEGFDLDPSDKYPGVSRAFRRRQAFSEAWDRINGARPGGSWESNPWVWVLDFKRVRP